MRHFYILLLSFVFPFLMFAQTEPTDTDNDGYRNISTLDNLLWLCMNNTEWDENYELDNDIDATDTENWYSGAGFLPIGDVSTNFSGKFDGNGYEISNLYINRGSTNHVGFFGYTSSGSEVKNLGLTNVDITGEYRVGALIGYSYSSVENCYTTGIVSYNGTHGGGLIGYSFKSITDSYSECSVDGADGYGGGLVGYQSNEIIRRSYATGDVTISGNYAGGFAGMASGTIIQNSYATGDVTSTSSFTGGLVGYLNNTYVKYSYSTGLVDGANNPVGGLIADINSTSSVEHSFWDTETSMQTDSDGGTGLTTSEMKDSTNYADEGWNFDVIWVIDDSVNNGYPYLDVRTIPLTQEKIPTDTDGDGYLNVKYFSHLVFISNNSDYWGYLYELDNDIDADSTKFWATLQGFSPIGTYDDGFTGEFNGNGYKIYNLYINRPNQDYIGLFGVINQNGTVSNLKITNSNYFGNSYLGGIAGMTRSGSEIINCSFSGNISAENSFTGGIAGVSYGKIQYCYSEGKIENGSNKIGGITGVNDGDISDSYSIADIINGGNTAGGIVGDDLSDEVNNCYFAGTITASGSEVGGLVADKNFSTEYINCYWDTEASGVSTSEAGEGRTTDEMKTDTTFTNNGWDFSSIWSIDSGKNNGYPYFDIIIYPVTVADMPIDHDADNRLNISTLAHLVWVSENSNYWGYSFELDNDIDADSTRYWSTFEGFSPIGNGETEFTGEFHGNGYSINNLYINRENDNYVGLFGKISSSSVLKELGLENADVTGNEYTSILCGNNFGGEINQCYVTGNLNGFKQVGAICGMNQGSTAQIKLSYAHADVTVGNSNGGTLVGINSSSASISNCYATGSITGVLNTIGGLVATNYLGNIEYCYAASEVLGSSPTKGGLVGYHSGDEAIASYWDTEASGINTSAAGEGRTTDEMKTDTTFTKNGWNYTNIWEIDSNENNGYPYLNPIIYPVTLADMPIDTDADGSLNISTLAHLVWVSENSSYWSYSYEIDNDIDADSTRYWETFTGFSPIGNTSTAFTGEFNGHGFEIQNLYINRPETTHNGLFGVLGSGAIIKNVKITNALYYGSSLTGGIAGLAQTNSEIFMCGFDGEIYSNGTNIGGIAGVHYGDIKYSYSKGIISVNSNNVGGITGFKYGSISNSYSLMNIESTGNSIGGLVGTDMSSYTENSYYAGVLTTDAIAQGGLVASKSDNADYINSYWDTEYSGIEVSDGGEGRTTDEMKTDTTFTNNGWDFSSIWSIDSGENDGYPYLDIIIYPVTLADMPIDHDADNLLNISTLAHLVWVSENSSYWSYSFELDNDIDADSTRYWETFEGFSPIGNSETEFSGEFHGNGYSINNLYINRENENYIGLFGKISSGSVIKELGLENADVTGNNFTSILCGYNEGGEINQCYAGGNVSGNISVGGICGYNTGNFSAIKYSYSNSDVYAKMSNAGALVGLNIYGSLISNSYAFGTVKSDSTNAGGLVGGNLNSIVEYSYSAAQVLGDINTKGGLIGYNTLNYVTKSYWDTEASGINISAAGEGRTTDEMKTDTTFTNNDWDFYNVWAMDDNENNGYPYISYSDGQTNYVIKALFKGYYENSVHKFVPVGVELRTGETLKDSEIYTVINANVNEDGEIIFNIPDNFDFDDYWVIIRTTAYLPLAAPNKITFDNNGFVYDFTTSSSQAVMGTSAMSEINGEWLVNPGDLNGDGSVGAFDINILIPSIGVSVSSQIPVE